MEKIMRKILVAGNWKMNKNISEGVELAKAVVESAGRAPADRNVMIAPPFTSLSEIAKIVKGTKVLLSAQNMSEKDDGAFTGEISSRMLLDFGVNCVILGHSESRHIYKESDELINQKIKKALQDGLKPVFCIGELLAEREAGNAFKVIEKQIKNGLQNIAEDELKDLVIAYEPVWAIGTGKTATPDDANNAHAHIRKIMTEIYSEAAAQNMTIQYGGSVKPTNIDELMAMEHIDGCLVGGASLKSDSFDRIINFE